MTQAKQYPSKKILNELFRYNNGKLYWKIKPSRNMDIGDLAGSFDSYGYRGITIKNKHYKHHRIVWIMHYGDIDRDIQIDHKKGLSDKIDNLRIATSSQNQHNRKINKNNKSGFKGVWWNKKRGKWEAYTRLKGKKIHLGRFNDPEVAAQIVRIERIRLHGEFANHG